MITVNESTRSQTSTANAILSAKASKNRVKNATEVLERYIEQFADVVQTNASGTPIAGCYGSSNVSLLSTKHKSISPTRKRRRKAAKSAEKEGSMSNDLVQWVNESYTKDLQRKIVPFGQRSNSSVDTDTLSQTEENGESIGDEVSTIESDVQLSTLPSPGNSDLDSNVDSLNTEILVRSYHRHHNSQPSQGKVKTHPSWVEELVTPKNYPSWIDDIDQTQTEQDAFNDQQNQRNRLSRSLSPSFFQGHPPRSRGAPSHLSTSLQDQPPEMSGTHRSKSKTWEVESTDTEVLISESIYGRHPVNMGGVLHSSLYHDKQIQHLHEHSVRKFAKDFERSLAKEMSFSQTRIEERKKDEKSGTQRKTAKGAVRTTEHPEEAPRPSQEDRGIENNYKTNFQTQRNRPNKKVISSTAAGPSSLDLLKKHSKKSMSENRKNSTDSTNTDKLMRQSPTGIRMGEKEVSPRNNRNLSNKDSKNNSSDKDSWNVSNKRSGGISTQGRTPILMRTPNTSHSTKGVRTSKMPHSAYDFSSPIAEVMPSHSASEELQRIIDEADINFDEATRQREDRYLGGKVTKKDLMVRHRNNNDRNLNNVRTNAPKGSHFKTSKPNEQHDNYLSRANPRTLSPRRLDPTDKRLPWDGNFASDDHASNVYERNTPGTGAPRWNSDPTRFYPRSRARTKSAPDMNAGRLWKSLPGHGKYNKQPLLRSSNVARRGAHNYANERRTSGADYANQKKISNDKYLDKRKISGADYVNQSNISDAKYANKLRISGADYTNQRNLSYAHNVNERETSYDDMDSVDTEALVIKPPMPIFDASPSLSTENAESSVGSEESGDILIENLAMRTSFLATDNDIQSSSGTSYLELATSPQQAQEVSQDWKEQLPPNARLNDYAKVTKPGIITSFLQDCMKSSQGSRSDKYNNGEFPKSSFNEEQSVISEDTSSERPVETLKKMLFTVQSLTRSSEDISDQDGNDHSLQTQSESLTEEMLSDILSTASCNEGQDSLSRAYYHLARLKRLVSASREVAAWK